MPNGWEYYTAIPGSPNLGWPTGTDVGSVNPGGTYYPDTAPEEDQIGYIAIPPGWAGGTTCYPDPGCSTGDGTYPAGIEQTLTATLSVNSLYELSFAVGNPGSPSGSQIYDGFAGYRVQLLAGGNVIAEDNDSMFVGEGTFETPTDPLSFLTGNAPTFLGMALGIRLINKNAISRTDVGVPDDGSVEWYSEIAFDDVQLTVSAVPVPAAVWLFGTALVGLVGFSKRRKAV